MALFPVCYVGNFEVRCVRPVCVMGGMIQSGVFKPTRDRLYVAGSWDNWVGRYEMVPSPKNSRLYVPKPIAYDYRTVNGQAVEGYGPRFTDYAIPFYRSPNTGTGTSGYLLNLQDSGQPQLRYKFIMESPSYPGEWEQIDSDRYFAVERPILSSVAIRDIVETAGTAVAFSVGNVAINFPVGATVIISGATPSVYNNRHRIFNKAAVGQFSFYVDETAGNATIDCTATYYRRANNVAAEKTQAGRTRASWYDRSFGDFQYYPSFDPNKLKNLSHEPLDDKNFCLQLPPAYFGDYTKEVYIPTQEYGSGYVSELVATDPRSYPESLAESEFPYYLPEGYYTDHEELESPQNISTMRRRAVSSEIWVTPLPEFPIVDADSYWVGWFKTGTLLGGGPFDINFSEVDNRCSTNINNLIPQVAKVLSDAPYYVDREAALNSWAYVGPVIGVDWINRIFPGNSSSYADVRGYAYLEDLPGGFKKRVLEVSYGAGTAQAGKAIGTGTITPGGTGGWNTGAGFVLCYTKYTLILDPLGCKDLSALPPNERFRYAYPTHLYLNRPVAASWAAASEYMVGYTDEYWPNTRIDGGWIISVSGIPSFNLSYLPTINYAGQTRPHVTCFVGRPVFIPIPFNDGRDWRMVENLVYANLPPGLECGAPLGSPDRKYNWLKLTRRSNWGLSAYPEFASEYSNPLKEGLTTGELQDGQWWGRIQPTGYYGYIKGTPSTSGEYLVELEASNPVGSASITIFIEVKHPPPELLENQNFYLSIGQPALCEIALTPESGQITQATFTLPSPFTRLAGATSLKFQGTPTSVGRFQVSITVSGPGGSDTKLATIWVNGFVHLNLRNLLKNLTAAEANPASGDIRKLIYALAEDLFSAHYKKHKELNWRFSRTSATKKLVPYTEMGGPADNKPGELVMLYEFTFDCNPDPNKNLEILPEP